MGIAMTLKQYLDDRHVEYDVMSHKKTGCSTRTAQASHVSGDCLAKAVILRKDGGYVMAVVPASRHVALAEIGHRLDQPVGLATEDEIGRLFPDCEVGAIPAVPEAYGMDAMVDESLDAQEDIYIEGGDHRSLIHLRGREFRELMRDVPHDRISV